MERLVSLFGLGMMVVFAWAMSSDRRRFPWRVVMGGLLLQIVFAILVLKTTAGRLVFDFIGKAFTTLLGFVDEGSRFVFGERFAESPIAFKVLPTIVFFSALMSILYHLGIMQRLIAILAVVMRRTVRISGAESLAAAANVFVGQTEAPLVIRPYLETMTRSELMATMVGGFATIAGGVLAAYVGMGIDGGHLITASVISAPAALLIAKVCQPEVEHSMTFGRVEVAVPKTSVNVLDAITKGTTDGVKLAINVGAMLLVFTALIALADAGVGGIGGWFGFEGWSLSRVLGYVFAPFAWLLGIESGDCLRAGELLGVKMVSTEFVAYDRMASWLKPDSNVNLGERSVVILTYALCGFANFASIGIQIGGIGALVPARSADLARLGFRAMLGGTLAAFMTACVAGILV